jgi:hypothetical protein
MNYSQYEIVGDLTRKGNLYLNIQMPTAPNGVNYTELGVFISGLLLSLGGCFALVFSNLRKSNCSDIELGCFRCHRENLNIEE